MKTDRLAQEAQEAMEGCARLLEYFILNNKNPTDTLKIITTFLIIFLAKNTEMPKDRIKEYYDLMFIETIRTREKP